MADTNTCDSFFESMKVRDLRDYLRKHGQLLSGTKQELIRRAKGTFQLLLQRAADAADTTTPGSTSRTSTCTTTTTGTSDETTDSSENLTVSKLQRWIPVESVSCDNWPDVTDKELYNYLVYTCHKSVDLKSKNARRQLKAHIFYEDGHVHSVSYHPLAEESDQCYVKCLVIPSAAASDKKTYPDRTVWTRASKITGQISSAYCNCTAGLEGSCNHVAALLYAMVAISQEKRTGMDACTSKTCKWKQPRKRRLSPKKSAHFKRCRADNSEPPKSAVNLKSFAERLMKCAPDAGWLINVTAPNAPSDGMKHIHVHTLAEPMFQFADHVNISSEECKKVFAEFIEKQSLSYNEEDRLLTEQATRDQNSSDLWFQAREGRLTASNFGAIYRQKPETKPDFLMKTVMGYKLPIDNEHLKWGRSHEPAGRRCYFKNMQRTHPGIQVRKSGLILDKYMPFLAASPDGLVTCPHCAPTQGLLEVKCPSKHKDITPETACAQDKTFCCHIVDGHVTLKKNHKYYYQVQGQMGVSGRQWCDFVVWTMKGYSIERIYFDKDLWDKMVMKLEAFYRNAIVPEVFTNRVKREKSLCA